VVFAHEDIMLRVPMMCTCFRVHRNYMRWLVSFVHVLDDGYGWVRCLLLIRWDMGRKILASFTDG